MIKKNKIIEKEIMERNRDKKIEIREMEIRWIEIMR